MPKRDIQTQKIPCARDSMDTGGPTLRPDADLIDAITELAKQQASAAPVVDEQDHLLGMLTEKDCLRVVSNAAFDTPAAGTVADYMSPPRAVLDPEMDLFRVVESFLATNFPMLPVVDGGRLVGHVTRLQVLKRILSFSEQLASERQKAGAVASAPSRRPHSIEQMQRALADYRRRHD